MLGINWKQCLAIVSFSAAAVAAPVDQSSLRNAVEKSVAVLLPTGPGFVKQSGCVSCHHNTLPVMAARLASERGIHVDTENEQRQLKLINGFVKPLGELMLESTDTVPDTQVTLPYVLLSYSAEKVAPNDVTSAAVHGIAAKQLPDGSWPSYISRPPIENGDIQATALSVRAIQLYGMPGRAEEWKRRIADARHWLDHAAAFSTEDKIMLLSGRAWAGSQPESVQEAARKLLSEQRADGGWAQLKTLDSDAYATGKALVALYEAGILKATDAAYRRGVEYLLRTQQQDGSWLVKTRAFPFQPLKDSGFPHGRDQWISAAGTSWAAMALTYAIETPVASLSVGD